MKAQGSFDFYAILKTRKGGFSILVKALKQSRQTGALDLLKQTANTERKPEKERRFIQSPKKVIELLSSEACKVLLLGTCRAAITKEKILSNVLEAKHVQETTILSDKFSWCDAPSIMVIDKFTKIIELISFMDTHGDKVKLIVIIQTSNILEFLKSNNIRLQDVSYGYDTISWGCLGDLHKEKILSRLEQKCLGFQLIDCFESMQEEHVVTLINEKEGVLFTNNLPHEPSYYIPRTLVGRNKISFSVLDKPTNDIWLIENIDDLTLANKASKAVTATCTDQLCDQEITCSFMTVAHQTNFDEISTKTAKSVHLLKHENDSLYWVKTKGHIDEVLLSIDPESQSYMTECTFLYGLRDHYNSGTGDLVCISDTPGMGKSYLLYSLGRQLRLEFPERCVVCVSCVDLIEHAKLVSGGIFERNTLGLVIASAISKSNLAKYVFIYNLCSAFNKFELMLDGYDEIHMNDIQLADLVLKQININYPKIRIWLTSRPHYLKRLEISFSILGYNIFPFNHENQLSFLQKFWQDSAISQNTRLNAPRLKEYAENCLQTIKNELNKDDNDIVGVPLQCMLLAQIFKEDVFQYTQHQTTNVLIDIKRFNINNISDLFDLLVTTKLNNYMQKIGGINKLLENQLLEIHYYFSLLLQFPKYAKYYEDRLYHNNSSKNIFLAVGLMFSNDQNETPRFLHRTYAEYFAAKFVLASLKSGEMTQEFKSLLFTKILSNQQTSFVIPYKTQITSYMFVEHPICHFLNAVLPRSNAMDPFYVGLYNKFDEYYKQTFFVKRIGHACAQSNHLQILTFLSETKALENYSNYFLLNNEFLSIVVYRCDVSFVKFCVNLFTLYNLAPIDSIRIRTFTSNTTLFHLAVAAGQFATTQFLTKSLGFQSCLEAQHIDFHNVIKSCVEFSIDDPKSVVKDKQKILEYLLRRFNWSFLSKNSDITPVLCKEINISYLDTLLKSKDECFATESKGRTVFHLLATRSTCFDLHRLLIHASAKILSSSEMTNLFGVLDNDKNTILHTLILSCNSAMTSILQIFKKFQNDFNTKNASGSSLLCSAVETHQKVEILANLVLFGADINFRLENESTLLHVAARVGNFNAANYILSLDLSSALNIKDSNGLVPIRHAENNLNDKNYSGQLECIKLFLRGPRCFYDTKNDFISLIGKHEEIGDEYLVSKMTSLEDSEGLVKMLVILSKKLNENYAYLDSVSLYISLNKNYLIYARNGVTKRKLVFEHPEQERQSVLSMLFLLSKTLKFQLGYLQYLSVPSNQKFAEDLLKWIFSQNISDVVLIELLEKFLSQFSSYSKKLDEMWLFVIKNAKTEAPISWIISKGASLNSVDYNQNTALHFALSLPKMTNFRVISFLIEAGSKVNSTNIQGKTPLSLGCNSLTLDSLKTFNLLVLHGALKTPVLATESLYWLIHQQNLSDEEFESTVTQLIFNEANIYSKENQFDQTLLGLAFEKQGVKKAMYLDKLYKKHCNKSEDHLNMPSKEDENILVSLTDGFCHYAQTFKITNKFISRYKFSGSTVRTKPTFSVNHLNELVKRIYEHSDEDTLILVAYMIHLHFRGGLEFVCEWFRKKMKADLSEQTLCFLNGQKTDLLFLAVGTGDIDCTEYILERVGFKKQLFSDKYKYLLSKCIHLENAPKVIEYFHGINPNLVLYNANDFLSSKYINPNTFISLAKIVGDVCVCSITKDNIYNVNNKGQTLLHLIPQIVNAEKYHDIIVSLEEAGLLDVFQKCCKYSGNSPLHESISWLELQSKTLKLIFQHNMDINKCNDLGQSVLLLAVKNKRSMEFLKYLISSGADLTVKTWDQDNLERTIIHLIVTEYVSTDDQLQQLLLCILNNGLMNCLNCTDKNKNAVLHCIFDNFMPSEETLHLLLHPCVNISIVNQFNQNILHIAVQKCMSAVNLKSLINYRVNTDQKDKNGKTFLHYAAQKFSLQNFEELLCILKSNTLTKLFNEPDTEGFTSLMYAARRCDLLGILVHHLYNENAIQWNFLDKTNRTFLHHVDIQEMDILSVDQMITCGVNIWQQDNQCENFAHFLAKSKSNSSFDILVKYFLKYGQLDILFMKNSSGYDSIFLSLQNCTISKNTLQSICEVESGKQNAQAENSYLNAAAMGTNIEYIKVLINYGANLLCSNKTGQSFMHILAKHSSPNTFDEVAKFLIEKKLAEVITSLDNQCNTPVHNAISSRSILPQTITCLYNSDVDLNVQNSFGCTPLHSAVEHYDFTLIKAFLNCKAKLSLVDSNGDTFLHKAAKYILQDSQCNLKDDTREVEEKASEVFHILVSYLANPEMSYVFKVPDSEGRLALHRAIQWFDVTLSTLQIFKEDSFGFSLTDYNRVPALLYAVFHQRSVSFLKNLISVMVDVHQTDKDGNNVTHILPQYYSAQEYHAMVSFLIEMGYGCLFRFLNKLNFSPLHSALLHSDILEDTIGLLKSIEYNMANDSNTFLNNKSKDALASHVCSKCNGCVHLNCPDNNGETILFLAVRKNRSLTLIKYLVQLGADPLAKNKNNNNLAHTAASFGSLELLKYFVNIDCDINEVDNDGNNALQYAIINQEPLIYDNLVYLINFGVDRTHANNVGRTAYQCALDHGISESEILDILNELDY